ncbi:MAG: class I SAM-dependent methyltransferase [Nitrospirales bacterium]
MSRIGVPPTLARLMKKIRQSPKIRSFEIDVKTRLGIPVRYNSPARTILESTILPYFSPSHEGSKVLFVGCDWYTKHYRTYFKQAEYCTIDPDRTKKRYGAKHHIVGTLERLNDYFPKDYFDVIFCNGVLGYGLNTPIQIQQAFSSCYTCLRPGGTFMLGREEGPKFLAFSNKEIPSLRPFTPFIFPPFGTSSYSTKPTYNYTFYFFEKPDSEISTCNQYEESPTTTTVRAATKYSSKLWSHRPLLPQR